jgi:protein phosphatase
MSAIFIKICPSSLVVLCGVAASGKSTFARKFFKRTQIVSTDNCRAMISDSAGNQSVSKDAFELFHFIVDRRLAADRIAVADATTLYHPARRELLGIAKKHRSRAVLIVLNIPSRLCVRRDALRKRCVGKDVIIRQYNMLQEALSSIHREGFDEVHILTQRQLENVKLGVMREVKRIPREGAEIR